jgi:hypothetical protein
VGKKRERQLRFVKAAVLVVCLGALGASAASAAKPAPTKLWLSDIILAEGTYYISGSLESKNQSCSPAKRRVVIKNLSSGRLVARFATDPMGASSTINVSTKVPIAVGDRLRFRVAPRKVRKPGKKPIRCAGLNRVKKVTYIGGSVG